MILKPAWAYSMELWGSATKSNINRIQSFQSKTLRTILGTPYTTNHTLLTDPNIPTIHTDLVILCSVTTPYIHFYGVSPTGSFSQQTDQAITNNISTNLIMIIINYKLVNDVKKKKM
ncbi:hypothetical protein AAG570_004160 [Ranatra chinensis]|uniref:RNA-directed DNA polymerase n=1 Tax=Ranatra chinensis TaxID=642074 RepID=A0ABD0YRK8_9HEMI